MEAVPEDAQRLELWRQLAWQIPGQGIKLNNLFSPFTLKKKDSEVSACCVTREIELSFIFLLNNNKLVVGW